MTKRQTPYKGSAAAFLRSPQKCVGVDAYIAPASCTDFTENSGEFAGTKWGDVGIAPY